MKYIDQMLTPATLIAQVADADNRIITRFGILKAKEVVQQIRKLRLKRAAQEELSVEMCLSETL